jgi:hypothetical protein
MIDREASDKTSQAPLFLAPLLRPTSIRTRVFDRRPDDFQARPNVSAVVRKTSGVKWRCVIPATI